ncbi:MAG: hypothetical protein QXK26_01815, partial [Candidatus Bathyarchaeia archaeon]
MPRRSWRFVEGSLRGFSLLELVLYFGILGLSLIVILPLITRFLSYANLYQDRISLRSETSRLLQRIFNQSVIALETNVLPDWGLVLTFRDGEVEGWRVSVPNVIGTSSLTGFAWFYGAGGLSLNCADLSVCGNSNYAVQRTAATNCLTASGASPINGYSYSGYAWSPSLGWLKFRNTEGGEPVYGVCESTSGELRGYAWNDMVGWFSFNCADGGNCSNINYKVVAIGNTLSGSAWNDTIGWLRFDGNAKQMYVYTGTYPNLV